MNTPSEARRHRWAFAAVIALAIGITACGDNADDSADIAVEPEPTSADVAPAQTAATSDSPGGDGETIGQADVGGFSLNGFRYCEILITVEGDDGAPVTEVWGTPGVGPCRDDAWNAVDPAALVAEFDASGIHMNGPRYFVVDGSVDAAVPTVEAADSNTEIRDFGGVDMRLLATVEGGSADDVPYDPVRVHRTATWTVNAGTQVYELSDAEGNTYIMQSYALVHDAELTADDLPSLGNRLDLPEGWSYRSRVLAQDLEVPLSPDGGAIVVQDELENSYQRSSY